MRQKDVLRDRHQRDQRQLLMDDDDPERLGIVDIAKAPLLASKTIVPRSCHGIDPAEHLHQRRLAGAVSPQGVDLAAALDGEIDVAQPCTLQSSC